MNMNWTRGRGCFNLGKRAIRTPKGRKMRSFLRFGVVLAILAGFFVVAGGSARAQENTAIPKMPAAIDALAKQGAQVRFLGKSHGLDGWLAIKQGQEQYFYVLPDGSAFLMGLLFDADGKLLTTQQLADLRKSGGDVLDMLDDTAASAANAARKRQEDGDKFKSPSERLYIDVEGSNWIPLGNPKAPYIYAFVDPQCPHCHQFIQDVRKPYLETGKLQVRIIPVGFKPQSKAQAAFLLASSDPQDRWFRHMDGDKDALPAKEDISQQGVEMNMALMQAWKFDVTPLIVYRAADGEVKLVRGRPNDIHGLVAELAPGDK